MSTLLISRSYEEGIVTSTAVAGQVAVEAASDGEMFACVSDQVVFPFNYSGPLVGCRDLSHLPDTHDVGVLFAVSQRFKSELNYSSVGPMLLALNPYRYRVYHPDVPHPRGIALDAWNSVNTISGDASRRGSAAVVVVTGQSGSGKTESAKIVIREIALHASKLQSTQPSQREEGDGDLLALLDAVNPVLESFGNAATRLSDNSSRFVKLVSLNVNNSCLSSATIEGLLLETSRVVSHAVGEGTFHVFNAMFASYQGLTVEERTELGVWDAALFKAMLASSLTPLAQSSSGGASGSSPASPAPSFAVSTTLAAALPPSPFSLQSVRDALGVVGFQQKEVWQVLCALAGILHLLNVEFHAEDAFAPAKVISTPSLEKAASLLGFSDPDGKGTGASVLEKALTTVMLGTNTRQLHKGAALATRDTLAKSMYEFLFSYLITRINTKLAGKSSDGVTSPLTPASRGPSQVVILDIFGFEAAPQGPASNNTTSSSSSAPVNDLEQLLINYTNEAVQAIYDETVFGQFQTEAEREGVAAAVNSGADAIAPPTCACLDVLTKKPNGVLHTITDESALGQQQTQANQLTEKILALQRVFPDVIKRNKTKPNVFLLQHYCEQVEYCTDFMTRKNRISTGVASLCRTSSNDVLKSAFVAFQGSSLVVTKNITSQVVLFREQMDRLASVLRGATSLHWIRCVKPNNDRSATFVDPPFVLSQLHSSGVSRTLGLLTNGYSIRIPHDAFSTKYLGPALRAHFRSLRSTPKKEESLGAVMDLFQQAKYREVCAFAARVLPCCQNKKLVVGATKAFLRNRTLQELQEVASALYKEIASLLQRFGRGFASRVRLVPVRMKLLEERRLAQCKARIDRELPVREKLEAERIALHESSADARHMLVRGLHSRMQRQTTLAMQKLKLASELICSELQRACNEVQAFDSVREKKEAELREIDEFNAHYAQQAEKALENARIASQAKEAARREAIAAEKARAEAVKNKSKILGHDRERQMVSAVLSAKAARVRATVQAEQESLARKAMSREAAEERRVRQHLAKQQQRIADQAAIRTEQRRQEEYVMFRVQSLHNRQAQPSPSRSLSAARAPSPTPIRRLTAASPTSRNRTEIVTRNPT